MCVRIGPCVVVAIASLRLLAQVPAHATVLNPTLAMGVPRVVHDGDVAHAFGIGNLTMLYARSPDGGRTWPLLEQLLPIATGGPTDPFQVVTRPGELWVLASGLGVGPQLIRSFDRGSSWTNAIAVAAAVVAQASAMWPTMHVSGQNVVVAWTNNRPDGRVWCNRSTDGGVTWQASDTRLDPNVAASSNPIVNLAVIGAGPLVHVFWVDGLPFRQRSSDGGVTWLPAALPTPPRLKVVGDGQRLFGIDNSGVVVRSTNAGDTWLPLSGVAIAQPRDIAMHGNDVIVTGLNALSPTIYSTNVSNDLGNTWPHLLSQLSPLVVTPSVFAEPGALSVTFRINGWPGGVSRTTDGGATWRLITGPVHHYAPAPERSMHIWTAQPVPGVDRHYAYVSVGGTLLGSPTPGSGGQAPFLRNVGLPVLGGTTVLSIANAVGGSLGAIGLSFSPATPTALGQATVWLADPVVIGGFATSGAVGVPGAGAASVSLAVPNVASLVGTHFVTQSLVADVGAVDGFTVTNALEVWLR